VGKRFKVGDLVALKKDASLMIEGVGDQWVWKDGAKAGMPMLVVDGISKRNPEEKACIFFEGVTGFLFEFELQLLQSGDH
jgi:hypothetical protein